MSDLEFKGLAERGNTSQELDLTEDELRLCTPPATPNEMTHNLPAVFPDFYPLVEEMTANGNISNEELGILNFHRIHLDTSGSILVAVDGLLGKIKSNPGLENYKNSPHYINLKSNYDRLKKARTTRFRNYLDKALEGVRGSGNSGAETTESSYVPQRSLMGVRQRVDGKPDEKDLNVQSY